MSWLSVFDAAHGPIAALGVGNFDGVHLGHQGVLGELRRSAGGGAVAVLVPDPHPLAVLGKPPLLLTTLEERGARLRHHGADVLLRLPFDAVVAAMEPAEFVERVVIGALSPLKVVVGFNFTFGRGGRAGSGELRQLLGARGVGFVEAPAVVVDGTPVSSSRIRSLLASGRVEDAARLLGQEHAISGDVRPGHGRGRTIGFPTANVHVPSDLMLPLDGVYAVHCELGGVTRAGVANLGPRPTFEEQERLLEVHLFEWDDDLYGQPVKVAFAARLRGQMRFSSADELRRQIALDSIQAKEMLGVAGA